MKQLAALACVMVMAASVPALAANAEHPYQNCNRRIDNCGPTGDNQVEQLSQQQLGGNPSAGTPGAAMPMPSEGGTAPTPGTPGMSR